MGGCKVYLWPRTSDDGVRVTLMIISRVHSQTNAEVGTHYVYSGEMGGCKVYPTKLALTAFECQSN